MGSGRRRPAAPSRDRRPGREPHGPVGARLARTAGPLSRRARRIPSAAGLQLEGVLLAGGLRALMLQLAHPAVGHGVAAHSDFAADPLGRLRGTLEFVYVCAAGDEALVRRAARAVGVAHRPVVSAPGEPVAYDAREPDLQLWVAATIHDTAMRIAEAVWGPMPAPLADELLARNGLVATALGLPASSWPADRAAFDAAFAESARALAWHDGTLEVVRALVAARATPWWVRLLMPPLASATLASLSGSARPDGVATASPRLLAVARAAAPAWRALPVGLRRLPARRLLRAAARRPA
ncbi:oxygenase MpaB family protein [Amnibacterium endophyticum]|uniref:Oxygenase MpaB family protein n=1 Tax=Amnibacterium endophyticum TaxID=2109337 RepID=A0ABW4LF55_9MICO